MEHRGYWKVYGYGIMSSYKSDWNRFGGECNFVVVLVGSGKLVEMVGGGGEFGAGPTTRQKLNIH